MAARKSSSNWMSNAVQHPGAFSAKAKAAGMSTSAYATKVLAPGSKASATTKKQASLAKTFAKTRKTGKKKKSS